jgi:hypothetical protein
MGRTLGTIVQIIQAEEASWQAFRRALRTEDRAAFDRLWTYVRFHAVAASMANRPVPFESLLLAMIVGLSKEVEDLQAQLKAHH